MSEKLAKAVFGGGCFWCTEAVFKELFGVSKVAPGYAGGEMANPTYEQVCTGRTGHAEVIYIEYDETKISYRDLLNVFFATHNPTELNRQGNDVGTQYRSSIFYSNDKEKVEAEKTIAQLTEEGTFDAPIVTTLEPLKNFTEAENYHHDYFANNPGNPYCAAIIPPKVKKLREKFTHLLKN